MTVISEQEKLDEFCINLAKEEYISIDTEFLRDKTYYAKLCLLQIGTSFGEFAIDMLAGADYKGLYKIINDSKILKIFHSARQDLEVIYHYSGALPTTIFDTQIASSFCGFGEAASYANLVKYFAGKDIDKSHRYTNWAKRPLSERQVEYALLDVHYLRMIYNILRKTLELNGRLEWVVEECELLLKKELYEVDPKKAYLRLTSHPEEDNQLLKLLAEWRENKAKKLDIPRGFVVPDRFLVQVSTIAPKKLRDFYKIHGFSKKEYSDEILEELLKITTETELSTKKASSHHKQYSKTEFEMLKLLLKAKSDETGIAERIIASKDKLEEIALKSPEELMKKPALIGWRQELFGELALKLKMGKIFLSSENGQMKIKD